MRSPELTPEMRRDLQVIRMRAYLDPKLHYGRESRKLPKHFQMGTVIGGATGYYRRLTRRQRATSLVDSVLGDTRTASYLRSRFTQAQQHKSQQARSAKHQLTNAGKRQQHKRFKQGKQ
ncbi:hypothetical protein H696_01441 [Fonticula alba]|uniref:Fcf2 pre-rRNA processing C-terminal domain-containing protein n=1 Tax=Fonticula alba TaxID=691883 RepID=A0A058ZCA1_FONAL|nr:hypothetical protein H696_01441 [Fonticula alba]KCV72035.1 hypothetical protein H696_01441 [Fonticula alba]|eukprot:XP_009493613.1 hypothetical protein H696_01441 [Fonticula alba]